MSQVKTSYYNNILYRIAVLFIAQIIRYSISHWIKISLLRNVHRYLLLIDLIIRFVLLGFNENINLIKKL